MAINRDYLKWRLASMVHTEIVVSSINSVADIFRMRKELKQIAGFDEDLRHLLKLLVDATESNKKFRQVECIKTIKRIFKNRTGECALPSDILNLVFILYQNYIFHRNEDVRWGVSVMLKHQILEDSQIQWLIENWQKSEHILNRLLRYPQPNDKISKWVYKLFLEQSNYIEDRSAEFLGKLLLDSFPVYFCDVSSKIKPWAIFYSHANTHTKQKLLLEILNTDNVEEVINVAERLNIPEVIMAIIDSSEIIFEEA
jgi:hypothetical protein